MFGERLRALRDEAHETQEVVAKAIELSRAAYSHLENNRNEPDRKTLVRLANHFGVTTDYLLGVNGTPKWATEKDVADLKKYISGDQSFYYGGEKLTEEENEQLKVALAAIFWKRHKK